MTTKQLNSVRTRFGTPVYVYDQKVIENQCENAKKHFPGFSIHYAMKANSNPTLLALIKRKGIGIEAVSGGELALARRLGFSKTRTSYTCSNQTPEELSAAARSSGIVHLDSLRQLEAWGKLKLGPEVSLRLNLGIGAGHHEHVITGGPQSKFGITERDIPEAKRIAARYGLAITGIQQHIGSNVLDPQPFVLAAEALLKQAIAFPGVVHIDFGGGFGVPYAPKEKELNLKKLGAELVRRTRAFEKTRGKKMTFAIEPGRYLVAEAGMLLVSVVDIKSTSERLFVGVNSGFNHLIRPAMYGSYHAVRRIGGKKGKRKILSVAGYVCETGDVFAHERMLEEPAVGDLLGIKNAGAYGFSMASSYNLRKLPREILVNGARMRDISFVPSRLAR